MDEGFSEDSRSQDEGDTPMAFESADTHAVPISPHRAMEYILGLDEADRKGKPDSRMIPGPQLTQTQPSRLLLRSPFGHPPLPSSSTVSAFAYT